MPTLTLVSTACLAAARAASARARRDSIRHLVKPVDPADLELIMAQG